MHHAKHVRVMFLEYIHVLISDRIMLMFVYVVHVVMHPDTIYFYKELILQHRYHVDEDDVFIIIKWRS